MEEHKDINNRLDELFAKARTDKPVMGVDQVRNLIAAAPVTGAPQSGKSSKSNMSLYILLGGIAIVAAISFGVWSYIDSNDKPVALTPTGANSTIGDNNSNINSAAENNQSNQAIESNTNSSIAQTEGDASENEGASANTVEPAKNEAASKAVIAPIEKPKPAETVVDPSKNKTYLITGGDFMVNFQADDKDVKMKLKDDNVKELSINGKAIAANDYPKYKDLIDTGKKMMEAEKSKNPSNASSSKSTEEQKRDEINTRLFNTFTDQLKKDKLINEDKYTFKLTSSELLIDGKAQPDAVRQKYIDLFKSTAGRDIGGTTFKFDHGMN